jgi:hypothetical protein
MAASGGEIKNNNSSNRRGHDSDGGRRALAAFSAVQTKETADVRLISRGIRRAQINSNQQHQRWASAKFQTVIALMKRLGEAAYCN